MTSISFTIPGKPTAWQRVGMNSRGPGPAIIYTKAKSRAYQSLIREAAQKQWESGPSDKAFALVVALYVRRPNSHMNKKGLKENAPRADRCMRKPDLDNIVKQVGDALNGVVWHDDAQIIRIIVDRSWWDYDSVSVFIEELP